MAIVNAHYGFCAKGGAVPKFTYTGEYNIRDDGVVELLTSGTIVFLEPKVIDVFMVGGGGSGVTPSYVQNINYSGYGGGGGGKTVTVRRANVGTAPINVTIGEGGVAPSINTAGRADGKSTIFGAYSAEGGSAPTGEDTFTRQKGGNGGSGGGGGVKSNSDYGEGGSDGSNGEQGTSANTGGTGQGSTTREFGEANGKLYAGGGGGGRYMVSSTPVISLGGSGGGGAGAWSTSRIDQGYQAAGAGVANTGGGGGGGVFDSTSSGTLAGGSGGSGIVCFREAKELPELAGRWVLNERLYAPESAFYENISFTVKTETGGETPANRVDISASTVKVRLTGAGNVTVYTFTNNSWDRKYKYWTFSVGANASDEFRAWLASNATKQS